MRCKITTFFSHIQHFLQKTHQSETFFYLAQKNASFSVYFNISKITFGSLRSRCVQRNCVICPQADVSCTYGAFHAAKPRCLVILCYRPKGGWLRIYYRKRLKNTPSVLLAERFSHKSVLLAIHFFCKSVVYIKHFL